MSKTAGIINTGGSTQTRKIAHVFMAVFSSIPWTLTAVNLALTHLIEETQAAGSEVKRSSAVWVFFFF